MSHHHKTLLSSMNADHFYQGLQWMIYDSFKIFMGLPTTGKCFNNALLLQMERERLIPLVGGAAPPPNTQKA